MLTLSVPELGQHSRWFAAVDGDGEWVGIALAATDDACNAHLFGMWVQPEARGNSAASLLCNACADWAASRGHETIELSVVLDNAHAVALYRKAGFVDVGSEIEDFGERSLRVSVMRRRI